MANCVTTVGYGVAEGIRFGATVIATLLKSAVAVAEFATSSEIAIANFKKLWDISSRGVALEEQQHGHLRGTYWPGENRFMAEFVRPTVWESQAVLSNRYAGRMWAAVAGGFAKRLKQMECDKSRYCGNAYSKAVQEVMAVRAVTKANLITLASQIARAEIDAINDRDFSRRKAAVVMRQGLIKQAAGLLAQAANGYAAAGSDAMAQANSALQSIGNNIGNLFANGDDFHRRALSSAGSSSRSSRGAVSGQGGQGLGGATSNLGDWTVEGDDGTSVGDPYADASANATQGYMPDTWTAGQSNSAQSTVKGGEAVDLARGGVDTFIGFGVAFQYNVQSSDLVSVDMYRTQSMQVGPPLLPGVPSVSTVTYLDALVSP